MSKLTEKQQAFAVNKAAGMKNREAAIGAGYSAKTADVQAANLLRREDIKKAIRGAKKGKGDTKSDDYGHDDVDRSSMPKARYDDAKEFLMDAMNHPRLPVAARAEYAKALLPYQHGRVGETGKKQSTKERAEKLSGGAKDGRPKFGTKNPPPLRAVGGTG